MQQIRIPYGYSPGIPIVKAYIRYSRFTAFNPTSGEMYWTIPEATSQDGSNSGIFGQLTEVNTEVGYAGAARRFNNFDNYIEYVGDTQQEEKKFEDSDEEKEQNQRTFKIVVPWFKNKDEKHETLEPETPATNETSSTTPETTPPPTDTPTPSEEEPKPKSYSADYTGSKFQYYYEMSDESGKRSFQMIHQIQAGNVTSSLVQKEPLLPSQEFRIRFKAFAPNEPDKEGIVAPSTFGQPVETTPDSVAQPCGVTGPFLAFEIGKGNPDENYWLVFPYNQLPFVQKGNKNNELRETIDASWILNFDHPGFYDLRFYDHQNAIVIEKNGSPTFSYPSKGVHAKNEGTEFSEAVKNGSHNLPTSVHLPGGNLKIHSRGITFIVHVEPISFEFDDNSQVSQALGYANKNTIWSPISYYSIEQTIKELQQDRVPAFTHIFKGANQVGIENDPSKPESTRAGIDLNSAVTVEFVPVPLEGANSYGGLTSNLDANTTLYMRAYRLKATFNRVASPYSTISSNYFRAKLNTVRTICRSSVNFLFNLGGINTFDISNHILSANYNYRHEGHTFIRKSWQLECLVPKDDVQTRGGLITTRTISQNPFGFSWEKLSRNPAWVYIYAFWSSGTQYDDFIANVSGANTPVSPSFTGISQGGSLSYTHQRDSLQLNCTDFISILEKQTIYNSPYYDGMSAPWAIASILDRAGFQSFIQLGVNPGAEAGLDEAIGVWFVPDGSGGVGAQNQVNYGTGTFRWTLPYSGVFSRPAIHFDNGTSYADCIKSIVQRFRLVFYNDSFGIFRLRDAPGSIDLSTLESSGLYTTTNSAARSTHLDYDALGVNRFFSMPDRTNDVMKLLLEKKTTRVDTHNQGWANVFTIYTVDKWTGNLHGVTRSDPSSVVDPTSPNFLGYIRSWFSNKAALGSRQAANAALSTISSIIGYPRTQVDFQIWGQDTILPLDVIQVDNNQFRVIEVNGSIQRDSTHWRTNVSAEHWGPWNSDENTIRTLT